MDHVSFVVNRVRSQIEERSKQTLYQELVKLVSQYFDENPDRIYESAIALNIRSLLTKCERMDAKAFMPGDRVLLANSSGGLVEGSIVSPCPMVAGSWRVKYTHAGGELTDSFPEYRLIIPAIPAALEGD